MPPNLSQLLDDISYVASLEHALVVDHLQVYYALGTDGDLGGPGPSSTAGSEAAGIAFALAVDDMGHFSSLSRALAIGGRRPVVHRASHVQPAWGPAIPVGSLTAAAFDAFAVRQKEIASAVDARQAALQVGLGAAAGSGDPVLEQIGFALLGTVEHAPREAELTDRLAALTPPQYLRATRTEAADDLERNLLRVSNRYYKTLMAILGARFAAEDEVGGDLFGRGQTAMKEMDECNKLLVVRGLIPRFAAP